MPYQLSDAAAIVASQNNQLKDMLPGYRRCGFVQLYAKETNLGTVWIGGVNTVAERGIPLHPGGSMFLPLQTPSSEFIAPDSMKCFFELNTDVVYVVFSEYYAN